MGTFTSFSKAIKSGLDNAPRLAKRDRPTIPEILKLGGKYFVDRVREHGYNDRGKKMLIHEWYAEYLELIGDLTVHEVYTTGCAQAGKTAGHTLLAVHLINSGISILWSYAQLGSLQRAVPLQFKPVIEKWLASEGTRATGAQNSSLYQVGDANALFTYVSTSKAALNTKDGGAAAGSAIVSVTADVLFREEKSQYPIGTGDPLLRRIDASIVPTKPIRDLGTHGSGSGIEADIAKCKYYFYPHFRCGKCDRVSPLDPKGCLLKPIKYADSLGREISSHLSQTGRPVAWHCTEENNQVESAYFGCPHCGAEIPDSDRLNAWYQCLNTDITLRNYLDSSDRLNERSRQKVGISISPLLRQTEHSLAIEIIQLGLETANTEDWQQQVLGHPSVVYGNRISLEFIKAALYAPKPDRAPDYIVAGIDQGRGEDWLMIVAIYLPDKVEGINDILRFEKAKRVILFGADIMRSQIPELLKQFKVTYGLMDNEPTREKAMEICRESGGTLQIANQIAGLKDAVRKVTVEDGGESEECWNIRNEKFIQAVVDGFLTAAEDGSPLYRLPANWEQWLGKNTERSPIRHLCAPHRDPVKGWQRAKDGIDDLFYALVFAEAAFYLHLTNTITYQAGMF